MKIVDTPLLGLKVVHSSEIRDNRGTFSRLFCDSELAPVLGGKNISQINHSKTALVGTIRGMHFQYPPHSEIKFVRCIRGRIWDVAVDFRENSDTFLQWYAEELTPESGKMLVIPEGFAHGFQVLESNSELLYLHTSRYKAAAEGGLRFDDPCLAIFWPLSPTNISARDLEHRLLNRDTPGIKI